MRKKAEHPDCQYCEVRYKSVFTELGEVDMQRLNVNKGCNFYKKDQVLFAEGGFPHGLFCMNDGKIKVAKIGEGGREQIVRLAKAGDILGYRALLSGDQYTCSATVIEDSTVCFIPKEFFFSLIEKNAPLSLQVLKMLSYDLKKAENKITDLAQKPVRERLAEALLFLKETYGFEKDMATINVSFTREEIANIVGTATETAIRLLSEFKHDHIIELKGKRIKILDHQKLLKTANVLD